MPMLDSMVGTLLGLALAALVRLAWRAWAREPRTVSARMAALQRDVEFFLTGGAPSLQEYRALSEPELERLVQARGLAAGLLNRPADRLPPPSDAPGSLRQRAEARQAMELSVHPATGEIAGSTGPHIAEIP